MFFSFRAGFAASSFQPTNLVKTMEVAEVRICLTQHMLLTARVAQIPEGVQLLPEVEQSLIDGRGGRTCGELATTILERATARSAAASREAFERTLALRASFQSGALVLKGSRPLARKELAKLSQELSSVRYD